MTSIDDVIRLLEAAKESGSKPSKSSKKRSKTRSASAYNKRYSQAFKSLAPKYKTKKGAWKKNGYRACVKAAHKKARK